MPIVEHKRYDGTYQTRFHVSREQYTINLAQMSYNLRQTTNHQTHYNPDNDKLRKKQNLSPGLSSQRLKEKKVPKTG